MLDDELPLDELAAQNPGRFEGRVDILTWRPSAACDPATSTIILLDQQGKPMACQLTALPRNPEALRFQISETQERPAFAHVQHRDGTLSAPAIVTLIDRLRAVVRETFSREADKALRQLEDETEASLLLMDVLNVLERLEQGQSAAKEPLSIPKAVRTRKRRTRIPQAELRGVYSRTAAAQRQRNSPTAASPALISRSSADT